MGGILAEITQHRSQKNGAIVEWFAVWWSPAWLISSGQIQCGASATNFFPLALLFCALLESNQTLDEIGRHHRRLQGFRERRVTIALKIAQIITLLNQKVGERPIVLDHLHPLVQQSQRR